MRIFTDLQEKSLLCYIGDISGKQPFFNDKKAYVTLNSLFFQDIYSEYARSCEGKRLNADIISDIPRLMGFFESLFSAFGRAHMSENAITYRVERTSDFEICRQFGRTISMTSTSLAGFLDNYRDRSGITLMDFSIPKGSHCINISETLGFYAKPEEAEILIPPFMSLDITEVLLSDKEKNITDREGNPPNLSVSVKVGSLSKCDASDDVEVGECLAGARVYNALNAGKRPMDSDILEYSEWKKILSKKLYYMLKEFMK